MILHRLASAIRHQNWSQIITEILIVVIGIFLGLQVTEWNEGRNDDTEEALVVSNLISDMEENARIIEAIISAASQNNDRSERVLEILESGNLEPEDVALFENGLSRFSRVGNINFINSALNDDNLAIIQGDDIRRVITDYVGISITLSDVIGRITERVNAARIVTIAKVAVIQGREVEFITYYDFNSLKDDREYRTALINIYGARLLIDQTFRAMLAATERLIIAIKQYQAGQLVKEVDFMLILSSADRFPQ